MFNIPFTTILKVFFKDLWNRRPEFLKKEYWVEEFPTSYHPECFRCNMGPKECIDCKFRAWGQEPNTKCVDDKWVSC